MCVIDPGLLVDAKRRFHHRATVTSIRADHGKTVRQGRRPDQAENITQSGWKLAIHFAATLEKNAKKKNALRGSTMTSLAEAQLYARMAITALKHAGAKRSMED